MENIKKNLEEVEKSIETACIKSQRKCEDITLIAVTKTKPIEVLEEAYNLGMYHVGENKVQEIREKYPCFENKLKWHMIGHLQTNKVKYIIDKVDLIHSVDSIKLATKINNEAKKINKVQDILLQVKLADEETKFGITVDALEEIAEEIGKLSNISIRGLMTIAPFVVNPEENRLLFRQLKQLHVDMTIKNVDNNNIDILSMGMTNDYHIAIEEGATMVRIGTGLFGKRNYN